MEKEIICVLIVGYENPLASVLAGKLIQIPEFDIILDKNVKSLSSYDKDSIDVVVDFSTPSEIMLNYLTYKENGWPFIIETNGVDYEFLKKEIWGERNINALIDNKISIGKAIYIMSLKNLTDNLNKNLLDRYEHEIEIKENSFSFHNFVLNGKTDFCFSWIEYDVVDSYIKAIRFMYARKFFFTSTIFNMTDVVSWKK